MATQRFDWICDICHEQYPTLISAEKCERTHVKLKIENMLPHFRQQETTPRQITVKFSNGEVWKYGRQCVVPEGCADCWGKYGSRPSLCDTCRIKNSCSESGVY